MKYTPLAFIFSLLSLPVLHAQGISAPWDMSQTAIALALQADKLTPVLEQLNPDAWKAKGAPDAYVAQAQSVRNESGYLISAAKAFERQPERLTLAISTYFRMQAVESMINSLADGVRRYQDPKLGDELVRTVAENYTNRDQLRQYISDLADTREQELKVIDSEAQRCRGTLLRQPPAPPVRQSTPRPAAATPKPPSK